MNDEAQLRKAKFYALKAINHSPKTVTQLREKLGQKGYSAEIIESVISEFDKKGLLDDTKFSKLWIDSRMAVRPKGRILLKQELKEKGVNEQLIEKALKKADSEYDEYEVVKNLAESRMAYLKGFDKKTAKRRLFGFLQRRGFEFDTIMRVVSELVR